MNAQEDGGRMSEFITNAELRIEAERLCDENDQLRAENAKLVDVLHEVEREAIYAYHSLQQDCVTITNHSDDLFKKWWHADCELDRAKDENAKLRKLVRKLLTGYECGATNFYLCDFCLMRNGHHPSFSIGLRPDEVRCYAYGLTKKRVMSDRDSHPLDVCSHWKPRAEVTSMPEYIDRLPVRGAGDAERRG